MIPIILSIILIIALVFSISTVVRKRKKAGITGIKSALTSICFYLIAVTNLLAYWFDFMGLMSWSITVILLILGSFFTKYMSMSEK
ncbi:CHASE2 domain-containing sensor protein [Oikeobacillus pervagus]|uniref:CHASE2 domain-containing sensor protein n=1 Tax=Oikeobacillus pervagus TaxID=1325931 RepID=A0AAJ1T3Q1_9BACI|nr:hypothetical protein [Oikeobacillus pervagus]MDQ0216672.1 CHASE2 domain-containing sensor protein [Oikeobacillus pervagus]